jgi:putative transposase
MPRSKPAYPSEFKAEAVRLVGSGERSLSALARDLEVADQTLRNWVRHAESDDGLREVLAPSEREELRHLRREVRTLRREREILKSRSLLRQRERHDPVAVFAFVEAEKDHFPVATLCRLLGVSRSGYYAWWTRPPSARACADQALTRHIRAIYEQSRCTYGAPRIWAELRDRGVVYSRKRVARLLRLAGLHG